MFTCYLYIEVLGFQPSLTSEHKSFSEENVKFLLVKTMRIKIEE